nr:hypothetical protein GCM10020093_021910 [Planobispora longispora]
MTISRVRMSIESLRLRQYPPQSRMAAVISGFLPNVRNSAIGGAPAGIIDRSTGATSSSSGSLSGAIRIPAPPPPPAASISESDHNASEIEAQGAREAREARAGAGSPPPAATSTRPRPRRVPLRHVSSGAPSASSGRSRNVRRGENMIGRKLAASTAAPAHNAARVPANSPINPASPAPIASAPVNMNRSVAVTRPSR